MIDSAFFVVIDFTVLSCVSSRSDGSSYGWLHEHEDFDLDDVQPPICRIEDWAASQVWNGGRRQGEREVR